MKLVTQLQKEDLKFYFSKKNLHFIRWNANRYRVKNKNKNVWDSYPVYLKHFSTQKILTQTILLTALATAYSWMPTMLDIYTNNPHIVFKKLSKHISYFKGIHSSNNLKINEEEVLQRLTDIKKLVNNSMVGASKVLHLFSPRYIPIIDSRVIKAWNLFFQDIKELKIKGELSPEKYFKYWFYLLTWKENMKLKSVRDIEIYFFKYGGSLRKK